MLPLHLGALHPIEQALTFGLAFGPFVVLGIVVVVMRRREARRDHDDRDDDYDDRAAQGRGRAPKA